MTRSDYARAWVMADRRGSAAAEHRQAGSFGSGIRSLRPSRISTCRSVPKIVCFDVGCRRTPACFSSRAPVGKREAEAEGSLRGRRDWSVLHTVRRWQSQRHVFGRAKRCGSSRRLVRRCQVRQWPFRPSQSPGLRPRSENSQGSHALKHRSPAGVRDRLDWHVLPRPGLGRTEPRPGA